MKMVGKTRFNSSLGSDNKEQFIAHHFYHNPSRLALSTSVLPAKVFGLVLAISMSGRRPGAIVFLFEIYSLFGNRYIRNNYSYSISIIFIRLFDYEFLYVYENIKYNTTINL